MTSRILPYLWYPLLFAVAIIVFAVFLNAGISLIYAVYLPIILVGLIVLFLEYQFPARQEWRPRWEDIKADTAFMLVVQILIPRILVFFALLGVAEYRHRNIDDGYWPHNWPLAIQIILVVLLVDFTRYWLHRACHHFTWLWRFHEVHHSPNILYLLNVGRFHPLEKSLHFCLDSLPFLLLGVAPEVLAGYFLLYSVNGFFQHSNLNLRYGWLNYLVGSAETHRWHHAKDPKTASCNFGNTTILWDLLFGTWYLPKNQSVDDIGIMNKTYPQGFLAQMKAPFRKRSGKKQPKSLLQFLANLLVNYQLMVISRWQSWRIARMARNPMLIQQRVLRSIIRLNAKTKFGIEHSFTSVRSYADYSRNVPVMEYEMLRPWINAHIDGEKNALLAEPPLHFVRTSGTTGQAKDIPLTHSHLQALRRIQRTAVAFQYRNNPAAFAGSILAITSPAREGVLANGQPFGSASGIVARNTTRLLREKFVVPAEVLAIDDYHLKYMLILRLALARSDITYIGTANATTLLMLIQLYREYQQEFNNDIRCGTFFLSEKLPVDLAKVVQRALKPLPDRAEQLQRLVAKPVIALSDLWPDLKMVVSWTCASAGIAINALRRELSPKVQIMELGYIASEFRGTVTVGRRSASGFPTINTHFFEFVEADKWDNGVHTFLTLDQLEKGSDYYVIITTPSGLYRYFINDLVRVTGYFYKTPLLQFIQKGKGVTNITGEKLYEAQVLSAVHGAIAEFGIATHFFMLLADEAHQYYHLYLELDSAVAAPTTEFAAAIDKHLARLNIEYSSKRESNRLGKLVTTWLNQGCADAYKQHCISQGQREGQFKISVLVYRDRMLFDLDAWAIEG